MYYDKNNLVDKLIIMDFTVDLDVASDRKGKYQILTKTVKTVKTVIINLSNRLF